MATLKADYGIDAPAVVRNLFLAGVIAGIAGALLYGIMVPVRPIAGTAPLDRRICIVILLACHRRVDGVEQQVREAPRAGAPH